MYIGHLPCSLACTDRNLPPQILGVRVAAPESRETIPHSDYSPHPVKADNRRLCRQAGSGEGGRGDDSEAQAHAANIPEPHRAASYPVERACLPPVPRWRGLLGLSIFLLGLAYKCSWNLYIDRGPELATNISAAEEHLEGAIPSTNRLLKCHCICRFVYAFCVTPSTTTRPALPGLRGLY